MTTATLGCRRSSAGEPTDADSGMVLIEELCQHPELIVEHVIDVDRMVLALHRDDYSLPEIQAQVRLLGLDPFGLQIVHLDEESGPGFGPTLAGLAARAEAFAGSEPEHAKAVFPTRMSRRALLTMPKPAYMAVPFVDQEACAADQGCRACADICPQAAYRWVEGRIQFNKDACEPCGRCVTACPAGAIANPTVTPAQVEAQIKAIVDTSANPIGLAFVCSRGTAALPAETWHAIEVPCTAMVPGSWLVGSLLLGAGAATALGCSQTGCFLQQDSVTDDAVSFARSLLVQAGHSPDLVPKAPGPLNLSPFEICTLDDPFGTSGPVEVIRALMASTRQPPIVFDHSGSPIGIVDIDSETCTACMTCSTTCPTGALSHHVGVDDVSLLFDPALCTACGQCVTRCPEVARGAISLTRGVDTRLLDLGPQVVNESAVNRCQSCGQPVAPVATMDRLGAILGSSHAATVQYLSTRCVDCRGKW